MNKTILIRGAMASDKRPVSFVSKTIPSIREWFDGELVVCTWKGQEKYLNGIEKFIDKIILIDDPGHGFIQAYNRQLISFERGLRDCSGDLVFVTRSDFQILSDPFHLWEKVPKENNGLMKIFDHRVIVGNMMTIHPQKTEASVSNFRVSDWIQLGLRSDLEKWASVLDVSKKLYKEATNRTNIDTSEYKTENYGSEQVWFVSLIHKFITNEINLTNYNRATIGEVWTAIVNNFCVLNTRSTLKAHNLNWEFQPEFHPWYMTEKEYFDVYFSFYGDKK